MPLSEEEKAELVAYLDGELDEAATQAIEAKIATNPDARAELDALKQTWGMLDYLPKASPSPNFTNRTLERLSLENVRASAKTQPMRRPASPLWAASLWVVCIGAALLAGYYATHFWPRPSPDEPMPDPDLPIVQHLRLMEKWRYYENADDLDFVEKLTHPDLFGEDPS
jgi:anti-sigma-K factor RskA